MAGTWLRWLIVVLGVALGLALVDTDHWLLGVLVLALALARAALLIRVQRRRAQFRDRRDGFGPRRPRQP
ncbi:MAG TPA: hypothetical protein VEH82_04305 [Acidimicrobiales bacterium]|nr:hypothetical protein [Acidimicrobiales bacterium]